MNNQPPQKPNYKTWLIVLIVVVALAAIGFANKRYLQLQYVNIKENPFGVNDNMYANDRALKTFPELGIRLLRLAKKIDGKGSPEIVLSGMFIPTKFMQQSNIRQIGKYLGHEIHTIKYTDMTRLENLYIIEANSALVKKMGDLDSTNKQNYIYINDKYYIEPYWVTNKNK